MMGSARTSTKKKKHKRRASDKSEEKSDPGTQEGETKEENPYPETEHLEMKNRMENKEKE